MLDQYHNQLSYTNVSHSDSTTVASMILHPRDGWYPSEEWVHNCTQDLSSRTEAEGEWDVPHSIALGDCIKFCKCYHRPLPNTSFNKLYHKRACHGPLSAGNGRFNLSIIDEVHAIQGKNPSLFMIPEPEALVIHLRLGDIVETSKSTVEQMLISGANPDSNPENFKRVSRVFMRYWITFTHPMQRLCTLLVGVIRNTFGKRVGYTLDVSTVPYKLQGTM